MRTIEVVCMSERNRSLTFRRVLNKLFAMYGETNYRARSSGILDGRQLTPTDANKAYKVVAVDEMVGNALRERFPELNPGRFIQLSVPDVYERDSPALIQRAEDFYLSDAWK